MFECNFGNLINNVNLVFLKREILSLAAVMKSILSCHIHQKKVLQLSETFSFLDKKYWKIIWFLPYLAEYKLTVFEQNLLLVFFSHFTEATMSLSVVSSFLQFLSFPLIFFKTPLVSLPSYCFHSLCSLHTDIWFILRIRMISIKLSFKIMFLKSFLG